MSPTWSAPVILRLNVRWALVMLPGPVVAAIWWMEMRWLSIFLAAVIFAFLAAALVGLYHAPRAPEALVAGGLSLSVLLVLLGATAIAGVCGALPSANRVAWIPGVLTACGWYSGYMIRRGLGERAGVGQAGFAYDVLFAAAGVVFDIAWILFIARFLILTPHRH